MSNYHILEQDDKANVVRVAFHIAVPAENNSAQPAAFALKDCLKGHLSPASLVPWLAAGDPTENTQIADGEIYEHVENVQFDNAKAPATTKRTQLDNRYNALAAAIPDKLRKRYYWWGYGRNVT